MAQIIPTMALLITTAILFTGAYVLVQMHRHPRLLSRCKSEYYYTGAVILFTVATCSWTSWVSVVLYYVLLVYTVLQALKFRNYGNYPAGLGKNTGKHLR